MQVNLLFEIYFHVIQLNHLKRYNSVPFWSICHSYFLKLKSKPSCHDAIFANNYKMLVVIIIMFYIFGQKFQWNSEMQVYTCMNNSWKYTPKHILVMVQTSPLNKDFVGFFLKFDPLNKLESEEI